MARVRKKKLTQLAEDIASWPPHWNFCDQEPGHEGKHCCTSCRVELGR
jgi:hypothetical protein